MSTVVSASGGDPMDPELETLEALYRDVGPNLLAYFRARPAVARGAEDLLQEVFVRALRHPERLRQSGSPRAYLFGIGRHLAIDFARRSRSFETLDEQMPAPPVAADARIEQLQAAMAELPEPQREALQLKLRHGLSYEEIAAVLEIPVGTVRSRLHYAVARLHERLIPNPARP